MKTRFAMVLVVTAVLGLMSSGAGAAIMEFAVQLAPGETGEVSPTDGNVAFDVYVNILGIDSDLTNDKLVQTYGGLSTPGSLLGNLSLTLASNMANAPAVNGTVQDRDADTDSDVGGTIHNTHVAGNEWIFGYGGISGVVGQHILLGSGVFTLNDVNPLIGETTGLLWTIRNKTDGLAGTKTLHKFNVDGVLKQLVGSDAGLSVGSAPVVTFVPEPVTMVLLAGGSVVLLLRRRKSQA